MQRWRKAIFTNKAKPDTGVESCSNLLCLSPDAHAHWNKRLFALKPLNFSADETEMSVQFFWQPKYGHDPSHKIKILTDTLSSKGMDGVGRDVFLCRREGDSPVFIRSGDSFTLKTDDPVERPLPSLDLIEMHWILQRLVGMSGAGDWTPLDDDSDSDGMGPDESCLFDEGFPDAKTKRSGNPRILGSSLASVDGVFDWIPPPDKTLPPEVPPLVAGSGELDASLSAKTALSAQPPDSLIADVESDRP